MAIKQIFIDFYGTLAREDEGQVRDICRSIAQASPQVVDYAEVAAYWWKTNGEYAQKCCGENFLALKQMDQAAITEVLEHFNVALDPTLLISELYGSWTAPVLFPDARTFVRGLPLPLCVVMNADRGDGEAMLRSSDMASVSLVCSEDALAYKPRIELFTKALEMMKIAPEEALFVGDSLKYDIEPAHAAGMYTAWINRSSRALMSDVTPDLTCTDLLELRALIR